GIVALWVIFVHQCSAGILLQGNRGRMESVSAVRRCNSNAESSPAPRSRWCRRPEEAARERGRHLSLARVPLAAGTSLGHWRGIWCSSVAYEWLA
ncbi:hypothetical protein BD414DRAFT_502592, partial [Trametes punicea]